MPNLGLPELILLLVVLAISVAFIAGGVWLIRSVVSGAERTRIQELEARVRQLEQRQR